VSLSKSIRYMHFTGGLHVVHRRSWLENNNALNTLCYMSYPHLQIILYIQDLTYRVQEMNKKNAYMLSNNVLMLEAVSDFELSN
jgi:hypothetical protein